MRARAVVGAGTAAVSIFLPGPVAMGVRAVPVKTLED